MKGGGGRELIKDVAYC